MSSVISIISLEIKLSRLITLFARWRKIDCTPSHYLFSPTSFFRRIAITFPPPPFTRVSLANPYLSLKITRLNSICIMFRSAKCVREYRRERSFDTTDKRLENAAYKSISRLLSHNEIVTYIWTNVVLSPATVQLT